MSCAIKTPATHPDHHVVGHYFAGHSYTHDKAQVYFCDSYDPALGYWMANIYDKADRKNVSERAIGRTFHEAYKHSTEFSCAQWHVKFPATCVTHGHDMQKVDYGEGRGSYRACKRCGLEVR